MIKIYKEMDEGNDNEDITISSVRAFHKSASKYTTKKVQN